ncbi:MAG: TlpA disulfide reductase family protein [Candidatus Brocadiia bacterium]
MIVSRKWRAAIFAVLAIFLQCIQIQSEGMNGPGAQASPDITIDSIRFGGLWMGNNISTDDLEGYVVAVEFWGKWCPPCREMIPHVVGWNTKYSAQGLIILGFHSTQSETKDEVAAFCKENKISYNIYDRGGVAGVEVKSVPYLILFNQEGKLVYNGHPASADSKLEELMKNARDPIVGDGVYNKIGGLAKKAQEKKELGKILNTLKTKHINSENAEEAAEAEKLVGNLTAYGECLLQRAELKKETYPTNAWNLYQKVANIYKGDEIGEKANKIIKELKVDKAFQDNLKADNELAQIKEEIKKFKKCNKCSRFSNNCEGCKKANSNYDNVLQRGQSLVKKYPNSPATPKVREILPVK